jgi:hypothetical protein
MKPLFAVLVASLAFGALPTSRVEARPLVLAKPIAKAAKAAKAEPGPTDVDKKVKLSPDGLKFGMTHEEISKLYQKVFDDEYVPLYKKVEPGTRMAELDSELADRKQLLDRNRLEFGALPSGLDNTAIAGEYSYNNGESMTQVKLRSGIQRYFFFFGNHLWKVYDVYKLGKKSKLGADIDAAIAGLQKSFGKPPRLRPADPAAKRNFDQADWQDKETIVRLVDHGGTGAGLAYIDRKVEEGIEKYRSNKGGPHDELDRDVSDVTKRDGKPAEDKNKNVSDAYSKKKK